jgi:hypothetical protein
MLAGLADSQAGSQLAEELLALAQTERQGTAAVRQKSKA